MGAKFHADGQTVVTKQIVAFRYFADAPIMGFKMNRSRTIDSMTVFLSISIEKNQGTKQRGLLILLLHEMEALPSSISL